MDQNKARELVESEGFRVIELLEEDGEVFVFLCYGEDNSEIEVSVVGGAVVISPT